MNAATWTCPEGHTDIRWLGKRQQVRQCRVCRRSSDDPTPEQIAAIYDEIEREAAAWRKAAVCRDCGACSMKEAQGKCQPTRGIDDEWSCDGMGLGEAGAEGWDDDDE